MKLMKKEVLHVAKLAKLTLGDDEINRFERQLSDVIGYFSELNEVDTKDVEPTSQTTGLVNVDRPDSIRNESLNVGKVLSGVDSSKNGYFVVPQLISKEDK